MSRPLLRPAAAAATAVAAVTLASIAATQTATAGAEQTRATQSAAEGVVGTIVRFSGRGTHVDVTVRSDNPTSRDFLSMLPLELKVHPTSRDFVSRLPMTITLEELSGREKIGYLDPKLDTDGSPGSDPEDGDLIYFVPWGNLGLYYNTEGVGYSDDTINLGTYRATRQQLEQLQGSDVRVTLVR